MREDIDAVEKAQGFLALRYELSGIDETTEGGVNHGSPLVAWKQVQDALNISERYRQYVTSVLNLDLRAQEIIRRHRLPERTIRPISQRLGKQPELQIEALNRIVAWQAENADEDQGQAVTKAVAALVENMLAREERRAARATAVPVSKEERQVAVLQSKVEAMLEFLESLGDEGRAQLVEELHTKGVYEGAVEEIRTLSQILQVMLIT